jgi:putative tricarboxylic transport membrane protein
VNSAIILGIASILLALVFRAQATGLPEVAMRLPVLLIWLVIGLAAMMIIEELLKRRKRGRMAAAFADEEVLAPVNWPVLGLFGAAIVTYVALIPVAGYLLTTPVFITGGLLLGKAVSPPRAILIGLVATALVWAIFIWALSLPVQLLPNLK